MPPKIMDQKDLADLTRHLMNQGTAEFQTKGFTEEQESKEIPRMFQEVWKAGYEFIHTLFIVPLDSDRKPYKVYVDNTYRS